MVMKITADRYVMWCELDLYINLNYDYADTVRLEYDNLPAVPILVTELEVHDPILPAVWL